MKTFKYLSLFVALVVCFACSSSDPGATGDQARTKAYDGPVVKNDWLATWMPANPSTLNPVLATDAYASEVFAYVFDRLLTYDPETGKPIGRLAKSWEVSEDGLTYDFYLRKNAKFHDGHPVTAEDVKFSFDIIQDPKVDAAHIQNYHKNIESVEVVDPHHVRFKMSEVYYRNLIITGLNDILPKHIYEKGDFNQNPANRAPVGSGPYKFEKWDTGRIIELSRVEDWWGSEVEYYKDRFNFLKIIMRVITDDSVAGLALKKEEIDMLAPTPKQFTKDLVGDEFEEKFHRLKYETPDGNGYRYIGWNLRQDKFSQKDVRRALAHAFPRDQLNMRMFDGLLNLSVGPFPQQSPKTHPEAQPIVYDLEKAKSLLARAGWKDTDDNGLVDKNGEDFVFELLFTANVPELERMSLIYQRSLREVGIQMNIRTLEWTVFLKRIMDAKFDAMMMAWGSSLDSDPYQIWHSSQIEGGGSNRVAYKNKRVDELLEKARVTLDREERNKLYQEFTKIVADEAPYLFIYERPNLMVIHKRFQKVLPVGKLGLDTPRMFTPPGREFYGKKEKK